MKYLAVVLHQLNNLVECFTPEQFLSLATVFQRTIEQQLFTILLKPSQYRQQIFIIKHSYSFRITLTPKSIYYQTPSYITNTTTENIFCRMLHRHFLASKVTAVTKVRSTTFGLVLHAQHIFANSFNFLVNCGLPVTIFHSKCIFCVYGMALCWPTLHMYVCIVCLPIRGAPW